MSETFDDILGGEAPALTSRQARAAAMMAEQAQLADIRRAGMGKVKIDAEDFHLPVNQNWLGRVLRMDPATVKKRLTGAPVAGTVGAGRPVYYFHAVIGYLVKPKMDIATYIKSLNPADLPNSINRTFWEAERIKNDVLLKTGEAWHSLKVLAVLGEVFMLIKDRIPLIQEALREMDIPPEAQKKLEEMCEQFQKDLYAALVEMPKRQQTFSRQTEIDPGDMPASAQMFDEPPIEFDGDDF